MDAIQWFVFSRFSLKRQYCFCVTICGGMYHYP
ncbi:Uncharacterised protein [Vibrio cholerae]|nr:Uncharacterised protein [Vibrio cholerae]